MGDKSTLSVTSRSFCLISTHWLIQVKLVEITESWPLDRWMKTDEMACYVWWKFSSCWPAEWTAETWQTLHLTAVTWIWVKNRRWLHFSGPVSLRHVRISAVLSCQPFTHEILKHWLVWMCVCIAASLFPPWKHHSTTTQACTHTVHIYMETVYVVCAYLL